MRLLTHNLLHSAHKRGVAIGYPLNLSVESLEFIDLKKRNSFLIYRVPELNWNAFLIGIQSIQQFFNDSLCILNAQKDENSGAQNTSNIDDNDNNNADANSNATITAHESSTSTATLNVVDQATEATTASSNASSTAVIVAEEEEEADQQKQQPTYMASVDDSDTTNSHPEQPPPPSSDANDANDIATAVVPAVVTSVTASAMATKNMLLANMNKVMYVTHYEFPSEFHDTLLSNPEFLQVMHYALMEIKIVNGLLLCPETQRKFPIVDGIPNMLLRGDELPTVVEVPVDVVDDICANANANADDTRDDIDVDIDIDVGNDSSNQNAVVINRNHISDVNIGAGSITAAANAAVSAVNASVAGVVPVVNATVIANTNKTHYYGYHENDDDTSTSAAPETFGDGNGDGDGDADDNINRMGRLDPSSQLGKDVIMADNRRVQLQHQSDDGSENRNNPYLDASLMQTTSVQFNPARNQQFMDKYQNSKEQEQEEQHGRGDGQGQPQSKDTVTNATTESNNNDSDVDV